MKAWRNEQIVLVVMLALTVGSVIWFGVMSRESETQSATLDPQLNSGDYVAQEIEEQSLPTTMAWPKPRAQSRGREWTYGVFTPPEIYYDAATKRFRATATAVEMPPPTAQGDAFGLELLDVEPAEFPLQLLGYVGEEGHFLGTFENKVNSETLLLRAGDKVASLGLTVAEFRVERVAVKIPESMTVNEYRAIATVRDEQTGEFTILRQGVTQPGDRLRAKVILNRDPETVRVVYERDVILDGLGRYIIEKIRLAPASVDVSKEQPYIAKSESQTLKPRAAAALTPP